ncbi:MAG: 50S ribosomal protein L32 [Planctomycetota bacterium]|jgi:large subunit ribosomal protein L32
MAVPKRKIAKSKTRMRASHHALRMRSLAACGHCGSTIRPHTVCGNCGHYRGNVIVNMEEDLD